MKAYKALLPDLRIIKYFGQRRKAFNLIYENFQDPELQAIARKPDGMTASFWNFKIGEDQDGKKMAIGAYTRPHRYDEVFVVEIE